jgi:hypothetical protein
MWDLRTYWGSLHVDAFNETIFVDILEIAIIFGIVYFFRHAIFSSCPHSNHLHILTFRPFRSWTTIFGMSIFSRYRG